MSRRKSRQVYHHCLFGTRYDFLCANYTAFDQTLFNCNFVSNVDCQNSKKFWHRNDELYKSKSTTTPAPVVYNFYTPPPDVYARTPYTTYQIPSDQAPQPGAPPQPPAYPQQPQVPPQQSPGLPPGPVEPKRRSRPLGRRRPQYDYYDDDYEERPIMVRRKRPRPRPIYYDDYEEYDDDRFERRGGGRRRRPYERRPMRREKDRRRKDDYEDEEEVYEDDFGTDKKSKGGRRKIQDDYDDEVERRDRYDKRRSGTRQAEKPSRKTKRPIDDYDDYEDVYERRKTDVGKRRAQTEDDDDNARKKPRLGVRRPPSEEHEDDLQRADEVKSYDRSRKSNKESSYRKPQDDTRAVIKPVSGTIYDRPRLAPRINLPVPKNAADKYAYKPIASQVPTVKKEMDPNISETKVIEENNSEGLARTYKRPKLESTSRDVHRSIRRRPVAELDRSSTTSTTTTTTEAPTSPQPVVRKFKRPFLPSRGGNPYSARSLEPLGEKALDDSDDEIQEGKPDTIRTPVRVKMSTTESSESKSGPMRIIVPIRVKPTTEISQNNEPTESRKFSEADLLDQNYDVSLNEALSPILPNLPVRSYPTGFSSSNDYIYNTRFPKTTKYTFLETDVSSRHKHKQQILKQFEQIDHRIY